MRLMGPTGTGGGLLYLRYDGGSWTTLDLSRQTSDQTMWTAMGSDDDHELEGLTSAQNGNSGCWMDWIMCALLRLTIYMK
jgi:hypothetical protein